MTDLEKLKAVFDEIGVSYKEDSSKMNNVNFLVLDSDYDNRYIYINFTDGKFVDIH